MASGARLCGGTQNVPRFRIVRRIRNLAPRRVQRVGRTLGKTKRNHKRIQGSGFERMGRGRNFAAGGGRGVSRNEVYTPPEQDKWK